MNILFEASDKPEKWTDYCDISTMVFNPDGPEETDVRQMLVNPFVQREIITSVYFYYSLMNWDLTIKPNHVFNNNTFLHKPNCKLKDCVKWIQTFSSKHIK